MWENSTSAKGAEHTMNLGKHVETLSSQYSHLT